MTLCSYVSCLCGTTTLELPSRRHVHQHDDVHDGLKLIDAPQGLHPHRPHTQRAWVQNTLRHWLELGAERILELSYSP